MLFVLIEIDFNQKTCFNDNITLKLIINEDDNINMLNS